LTHKSALHVEALARRIRDLSPDALIVVHHDARANDLPWDGQPPRGVHLVERGPVSWGDWSMIEASLRMLRFAIDRFDASWFVLLSGEHRPAVDLRQWEARTATSGIDALLGAERLPDRIHFGTTDFDRNQYLARSRLRWRLFPRPRSEVGHRLVGVLAKLSARTRPIVSVEYIHRRESWAVGWRRSSRPVRGVSFYRGSQWFALNHRAATAALAIQPALVEWFKESWIPDEAYLQTALRGDPGLVIADTPTTFVLDTPETPYPGWMQLSPADLPAVWASGLPFARKVDPSTRPGVVVSIDRVADRQRKNSEPATSREPDHTRPGTS
jgi:hypothetical protein